MNIKNTIILALALNIVCSNVFASEKEIFGDNFDECFSKLMLSSSEENDIYFLTNFIKEIKKEDINHPVILLKDESGKIHKSVPVLLSDEPTDKIKYFLSHLVYPSFELLDIFKSYAFDTGFMNFLSVLKTHLSIDIENGLKILNMLRSEALENNLINDQKHDFLPEYFENKSIYKDLITAFDKIDSLDKIRDGDTLVVVGNTPQLIYETHRILGKKKLNYIKVAISGTPGKYKPVSNWYESIIVTEKGMENYRKYLCEVEFLSEKNGGNIFFIDIISSGMGLKFLKKELVSSKFYSSDKQKIYMLGINPLNDWADTFNDDKEVEECLSLEMEELSTQLDKIPNWHDHPLRSMPRLPSSMWENMNIFDIINYPVGKKAEEIINNIKDRKF